jgi:hypothetical protein
VLHIIAGNGDKPNPTVLVIAGQADKFLIYMLYKGAMVADEHD